MRKGCDVATKILTKYVDQLHALANALRLKRITIWR